MLRRIGMCHRMFGSLILLTLIMFGSSCKDAKPDGACSYRLSRGGYSPSTHTLLIAVTADTDESLKTIGLAAKTSWLVTYNEEKRTVMHLLYPTNSSPFDFAWAPGQAVFVVTQGDRMTLFQKDASEYGYGGTAIRCPISFMYTCCSWNPKGKLLAVNCYDLERASGHRLGLYDLKEEKFVISSIVIDHRPPIWVNDTTLFITNHNSIVEVKLESGTPKLGQTVPIKGGLALFYGMFNDQTLIQRNKKIELGNRILVDLDRNSRYGVITTKTNVFVSASSSNLVVFDHSGREIDRINPGFIIHFGSIGEDPDTVYGLSGSMLLRISVKNENLNIHEVCDLADCK